LEDNLSQTDEQYRRYLEKHLERLEAVSKELEKPVESPSLLPSRLKVNGAGTFVWQGGHWQRVGG